MEPLNKVVQAVEFDELLNTYSELKEYKKNYDNSTLRIFSLYTCYKDYYYKDYYFYIGLNNNNLHMFITYEEKDSYVSNNWTILDKATKCGNVYICNDVTTVSTVTLIETYKYNMKHVKSSLEKAYGKKEEVVTNKNFNKTMLSLYNTMLEDEIDEELKF